MKIKHEEEIKFKKILENLHFKKIINDSEWPYRTFHLLFKKYLEGFFE